VRMQIALGTATAFLVIHSSLHACDNAISGVLDRADELNAIGRLDQLNEPRLRAVLNDCRDADPLTRACSL
jgi:hypothetical protein